MLTQLLQANADTTVKRGKGMTPLHMAVAIGNADAAETLCVFGADPYAINAEGTTSVDLAWNNRVLQDWVRGLGVADGTGATGTGRLATA